MKPVTSPSLQHEPLRPPLKWAGGKRWQVPLLLEMWRPHSGRRLVEPFCGGLAVALGLRPDNALLNDINPHVINFYAWLKKGLKVSQSFRNEERFYYERRTEFNKLQLNGQRGSSRTAELFYYLNRTGYNGLCRFNRSGEFNVPFGRYKRIPYRPDFLEYREAFSGWEFTTLDFGSVDIGPDDFVYADPPYDVDFTQYSQGGFGWEDQQRTAELLSAHPGPVVLANQATPRIVRLYRKLGFNLYRRLPYAPRRISCTGDRTPAREVLALKNL
ncbi:MAG: DNA adenine methylase [Candidatus Polarisedimenticolia bacterium]